MRGKFLVVVLASALIAVSASVASAQGEAFQLTSTDVGPVIGLGGIHGASVAVGGRFEKGIKELPDLHNGLLGIGAAFDWYKFSEDVGIGTGHSNYNWNWTAFAVMVNYHLRLDNKKIDPFFGGGLGYERVSVSGDACVVAGHDYCNFASGVYGVGHIGIRYYWQPQLALFADAGAGTGSLHVGIMYQVSR